MLQDLFNPTQLIAAQDQCDYQRIYGFGELSVKVKSNSEALLDELDLYYKSYVSSSNDESGKTLYVINQANIGYEHDWLDVPREAGKQGKKEGYLENVEGGRWIKKFKTGLTLLQHQSTPTVVGECEQQLAQIVNFINNQCLNHYLSQGFELGHASAFSREGKVTAIAAGSGGGKSTLMLRCLEDGARNFLTNDRLLFKHENGKVSAVGIAKLPRVNPGTLLNAPRLKHILPVQRQTELEKMPISELWGLEEKYDVQIEDEYGLGRVVLQGELVNLVMLDWALNSDEPTALLPVDLSAEAEEIDGLRKRPGPFFQDSNGVFSEDLNELASLSQYCQALAPINVYRLTGKIDFDRAFDLLETL